MSPVQFSATSVLGYARKLSLEGRKWVWTSSRALGGHAHMGCDGGGPPVGLSHCRPYRPAIAPKTACEYKEEKEGWVGSACWFSCSKEGTHFTL